MRPSVLFLALLSGSAANAQLAMNFSAATGGTTITFSERDGAPNYAFSGAAYAARQTHEQVQTLPDGTHIASKKTLTSIWQDSAGRKRTEQQFPFIGAKPVPVIQIMDPVEGAIYVLDSAASLAHRVKITAKVSAVHNSVPRSSPPFTKNNADGTVFTSETLGTQIIGGFNAYGQRMTTHYPAGSSMGNDRPVESTNEIWNVPQLGTAVLSKSSAPRSGDMTMTLDHIVPGEPDASLLRLPAGYRVVDETGPFRITIPQ